MRQFHDFFLNVVFGGFFFNWPSCAVQWESWCVLACFSSSGKRSRKKRVPPPVRRRLVLLWPILLCYTDCYSIVANSAHRLRILLTKELNSLPSSTTTSVSNTSSPVSKQRTTSYYIYIFRIVSQPLSLSLYLLWLYYYCVSSYLCT